MHVRTSKLYGRNKGAHAPKVLPTPSVRPPIVRQRALLLFGAIAIIGMTAGHRG